MKAKVLYFVSILLHLCKKQHPKDKCPLQRERKGFTNKENWKRINSKNCTAKICCCTQLCNSETFSASVCSDCHLLSTFKNQREKPQLSNLNEMSCVFIEYSALHPPCALDMKMSHLWVTQASH